jgi:serine/threonine protein kinase
MFEYVVTVPSEWEPESMTEHWERIETQLFVGVTDDPAGLVKILRRMMVLDPAKRSTATELLDDPYFQLGEVENSRRYMLNRQPQFQPLGLPRTVASCSRMTMPMRRANATHPAVSVLYKRQTFWATLPDTVSFPNSVSVVLRRFGWHGIASRGSLHLEWSTASHEF